jgi:anti-anti-sigma factor
MAVELVKDETTWTVKLTGITDIFEAVTLHQAALEVAEAAPGPIVVSLHDVEAIDTSATQILVALRRAVADSGRAMRVEGARAAVADTWRLLGVDGERG